MFYQPWFYSFEQFALSAACRIAFGCLLVLVRIEGSLKGICDKLNERP